MFKNYFILIIFINLELDKIPENMHNIVRAQVLLLLAHATSNTNNNMFNGMNKLYTGLFHM